MKTPRGSDGRFFEVSGSRTVEIHGVSEKEEGVSDHLRVFAYVNSVYRTYGTSMLLIRSNNIRPVAQSNALFRLNLF